jgi:hypothetical protein
VARLWTTQLADGSEQVTLAVRRLGEQMIKVKSTGYSSYRYGACEKCGKTCAEVFHAFGWTDLKFQSLFGCQECCAAMATTHNAADSQATVSRHDVQA